MHYFIVFCMLFFNLMCLFAQNKKMDHTTFDLWKTIEKPIISNNGEWVCYEIKPGKGNSEMNIYNTRSTKTYRFERGEGAIIDFSNEYIVFSLKQDIDKIDSLKRKKVKSKDLPLDTLVIFNCTTKETEKIPNLKNYKLPKNWGGFLAYTTKDSTQVNPKKKKTQINLSVRNLQNRAAQKIEKVDDFTFATRSKNIVWNTKQLDSTKIKKVQLLDLSEEVIHTLDATIGEIKNIGIRSDGEYAYYLMHQDTTDEEHKAFELYLWRKENKASRIIATHENKAYPNDLILNESKSPTFSDSGKRLYYGLKKKPIVRDTNLLENEIVNVEVWNYQDQKLYPHQKIQLDDEINKNYVVSYDLSQDKHVFLTDLSVPDIEYSTKHDGEIGIGTNSNDYNKYISWLGHNYKDVYIFNMNTGTREKILSKVNGRIGCSPASKYAYWYSRPDSVWYSYSIEEKIKKAITHKENIKCYDENNDRPMDAWSYGLATWIEQDNGMVIYDRYDLWLIDPSGKTKGKQLTDGRSQKSVYRYIALDDELTSIPMDTTILLHFHNESDKSEGYCLLDLSTLEIEVLQEGKYRYTKNPIKAKDGDEFIFTKESFELFPDLIYTNLNSFDGEIKFSSANPQQSEYDWGKIELFQWENHQGEIQDGLLVLPDNFDPKKKYPLMVNFYERNSHRLNHHRAPFPHRSTINYTYYANKGYVIFNPDIVYEIGEPGESCYNAVMTGLDALIEKGFIDEENIGVQGHSWGGYQIAHLLTKTGRFKCAESGAPVVNMVSAYGGIRWRSGLSRMFQYEKTQSRLGATLWEDPEVYLRNSPVFELDKITTPVLILHNDKDGAVPWYQGIEFFVGLRRLGKKAWMLNYNDEPHWPVKRQNRIDFNRRMEQFFDHYLMGKDAPEWMTKGVPAIEREVNSGY